jgi:hypothetical protein
LTASQAPTNSHITEQAKRLLELANAPATSKEVAVALKRWAKTDYHVTAIVQHILDSSRFFPTPLDIRVAAESVQAEPSKLRAVDPNCNACRGMGFTSIVRDGYSFASVCHCRTVKQASL